MTNKRPTIYLCGGMAGCTDAECKDWRDSAILQLHGLYDFRNPMVRDYRGVHETNEVAAEIVEADLADIDSSDILLVKANKPSWGTAMEVHYAYTKGKLVITFCDAEFPSPWLLYHTKQFFTNFEDAINYLKNL